MLLAANMGKEGTGRELERERERVIDPLGSDQMDVDPHTGPVWGYTTPVLLFNYSILLFFSFLSFFFFFPSVFY